MKTKKIKVAILIDQLIPGGVQKTAISEVLNLNKLGYQAKLLVLMRQGFKKNSASLLKHVPHEFLSDRYPKILQKSFKFPIFHFLSTLHIASPILAPLKIKKDEFDLVISHGTTTTPTALALKLAKNIPYIFIVHDPMRYILEKIYADTPLKIIFSPLKVLIFLTEKSLVKNARSCILDSTVHAPYLKEKYQTEAQVLPLAANIKEPVSLGDKILTFGRWDKRKNLTVLLKVVKDIPNSELIVAGTWTQKQDLQEFKNQVKNLKLEKKVEIIAHFKEKDLGTICKNARLWVHPHFEAFSLSALEAAGYGLPIVIPQKSGITSLFQDKVHGFFPRENSYQELKSAIMTLLSNKSQAQKMGKAAQIQAQKVANPRARTQQLAQIIKNSLKPTLIAIEAAHVGKRGTAGGDLLLAPMYKGIQKDINLIVLVTEINQKHWLDLKKVKLKTIPKNIFDSSTNPVNVALTYILRIIYSTLYLLKREQNILIYSSTDVLPDVIPAFLIKLVKPKIKWIARIHHISQKARIRPGNYLVNLISTSLQNLSVNCIKSKADLTLALNENLKKNLLKSGFPNQKLKVLGGGIDYEYIENFIPQKVAAFDAIFLGRLHRTKGIFDLPQIWAQVVKEIPKARLAIIGSHTQIVKLKLKNEIDKYAVHKNIRVLGFLPKDQVYSYLKSAKIFTFTDHEAGFGLAAAEAMAAGLPLVGYDIGILGIVFKQGFIKIPPFDREKFASAVVKILKDDYLREELSKKAQQEATKFDWPKITDKFSTFLKSLP